jgi:hypothetical protein
VGVIEMCVDELKVGDICTVISIDEDNEIVLQRSDGLKFSISEGWYDDDHVNNGIIISDGYKEE